MTNQKKVILIAIATVFSGSPAFSQNCKMGIKDGSKLTLQITTFSNSQKKDEKVAAFNVDALAGKIKPETHYDMVFIIKKKELIDADEYALGYTVGGVEYFSYVVCRNDTIYSCRNRGVVKIGTAEDPIGYTIQGIQTLPMNLKIGDVLPTYEDFGFLFPTSADVTLKKRVFSHYEKQGSHSDFGFFTDTQTGKSGFGSYNKTPADKAVYKTIDVEARKTISLTSHSIQGVNQRVTGEEEVTVSGVKYKAYIIEAESWSKSNFNTQYESLDEELNAAQSEADKKIGVKMEKLMTRRKFTNKLGYMVMYSTAWFVPELGTNVKSISYDLFGGISTIMTTTKLE